MPSSALTRSDGGLREGAAVNGTLRTQQERHITGRARADVRPAGGVGDRCGELFSALLNRSLCPCLI